MKKVFVFLANGFEEIEAISIIDVLRRGELDTTTVSITGDKKVVGAHNITVVADKLYNEVDFSEGQMLVLPGGMPGASNLDAHSGLKTLIKEYNLKGKNIAAICAAPLVFGGLGLLKDKKATAYPGFESQLIGAEYVEEGVVKDNNIITGRGPGFAADFALALVAELQGSDKANEVASGMLLK
ncbi:4-methyl-5(b-hydroxyethyl)-thiazole monophosphate biosynthesis [Dysgonomonadaceae bacterium PH5-43]|nr:4-methyl-5(b-hydroxyethyl)-thiazole monophosphate biosynthesis [Dysgonomonadaceae bacterium PH5-43]